MKEKEIIELNEFWYKSEHPQINPKYYNRIEKYENTKFMELKTNERLNHLFELLKLIHNYIYDAKNLDSINKYILKRVIKYYPFVTLNEKHINKEIKDLEFKAWLISLFKLEEKSVSWHPKIDMNLDMSLEEKLKIRYRRFNLLGKICYFIDEKQTLDYINNNIIIDNNGDIISGFQEKLIYGNKHILSAYLGQHIVRMFPYKDFTNFKSIKYQESNGSKKVYEHFTPMSFFRDIIWVKKMQDSCQLFNKNSVPFNDIEWLEILWYSYRTITITKGEDDNLNSNKYKSRRLFNTYENLDEKITINDLYNWKKFHSLDLLKKYLK